MEQALTGFLKTLGTDAADRVFPKVLAQGVARPAIVYHRVSGRHEHTHDGPTEYQEARFQLDLVGKNHDQLVRLEAAVKVALDGFRGTMGGTGGPEVDGAFVEDFGRDDYDDELEEHVRSLDVLIEFAEVPP